MKARLLAVTLLAITSFAPAHAEDSDAYMKVDANGNAIGGAIVCTASVCGDPNSGYSKATLGAGERYVLQFKGDRVTGNVAGIPATDPNVQLKVNTQTNEWTKTTTVPLPEPTTVTINNAPVTVVAVQTRETWNPTTPQPTSTPEPVAVPTPTPTPTPTVPTSFSNDSATVTTQPITTQTITGASETNPIENPVKETVDWLSLIYINWEQLLTWLMAYLAQMGL